VEGVTTVVWCCKAVDKGQGSTCEMRGAADAKCKTGMEYPVTGTVSPNGNYCCANVGAASALDCVDVAAGQPCAAPRTTVTMQK